MEGGQLCARLLAMLPEPKPPVFAVTGYASTEKLAEAKAAGMSGFITKPVTREKLERTIRSLAGGREPRRSLDAEMAPPGGKSPLASLGSLAPGPLQLAGQIAQQWQAVSALAAMQDPRTGHGAHRLRSLLLLAGEESAAEQVGLFEAAADGSDWATVQRLQSFVAEEITASESRLRS
jgi:CheY-like chemotaxis protein